MTVYSFTTIDYPLATNGTNINGISFSGQIVGTYTDAGGIHGFLDSSAVKGSSPNAINDAGRIVGNYVDANNLEHGFLYNGSYTTIDDPLATNGTIAEGISSTGTVVGYYFAGGNSSANRHGFI